MPKEASAARLKIITTGHGGGGTDNAAEFSDKTHTIWVGGQQRFAQRLWREDCMLNPVYPQDGTWPLSRGGWCPGDKITPWEQDITEFLTPGDSTAIDYKFQPYVNQDLSRGASYSTTGQLIFTGKPNFQNNVELLEIMQPNSDAPYNRMNPICASPSIKVKNLGEATLTSMTISYRAADAQFASMPWTGSLKYLEEITISLPPLEWETIFAQQSNNPVFEVRLNMPNGSTDEDLTNNSGKTNFSAPPIYYNEFEIRLLTNKYAAEQYSYTLKNAHGDIISEKAMMTDNTQYVDSLYLPDGCYEFRFKNREGYGLSWWLTESDLGSGTLRLSSLGRQYLQFNGDFGGEIFYQFRVGPKPGAIASASLLDFGSVDLLQKKEMTVYITPKNTLGLEVGTPTVSLKNRGFSIKNIEPAISDKLQLKYGDTLKITMEFAPPSEGNKVTYLNIPMNDQRNNPALQVKLNGWGGPVAGILDYEQNNESLYLEAIPTVGSDNFAIRFGTSGSAIKHASVIMINSLGQEIAGLFDGNLNVEEKQITLQTKDYPSGRYFIVLKTENGIRNASISIIK